MIPEANGRLCFQIFLNNTIVPPLSKYFKTPCDGCSVAFQEIIYEAGLGDNNEYTNIIYLVYNSHF